MLSEVQTVNGQALTWTLVAKNDYFYNLQSLIKIQLCCSGNPGLLYIYKEYKENCSCISVVGKLANCTSSQLHQLIHRLYEVMSLCLSVVRQLSVCSTRALSYIFTAAVLLNPTRTVSV